LLKSTLAKASWELCILAIRLLLPYPLRSDLRRISDPQLKVQLRQQSLKPARVPTRFHPHAHIHSAPFEFAVELLRFLPVPQSSFVQLPSFAIHKRNSLEARVVVTSLYLVCVCPIRSLCVRWGTGSGFGGRPFTPEALLFCSLDYR
jgi:hypothetical protein